MLRFVAITFLSTLFRGNVHSQAHPAQPGHNTAHRAASILGQWYVCSGRDTVWLEFDHSRLLTSNKDALPYRIQDDLIAIDEFVGGVQSQGFIRKLTNDTLMIEWTTGDLDIYQRPFPERRMRTWPVHQTVGPFTRVR